MGIFEKKNMIKIEKEDLNDAKLSTAGFDSSVKKRAFLNVLSARVAMKMLFEQEIEADNVYSLYTIQNILKRFDISDIYCGSTKLDVRTVFSRDEIFIPKSQYENSVIPDLYLFFELNSDITNAEFLGFISPDKINKANSNEAYYFVDIKDLVSPEELKNAIFSVPEKSRENVPESEMKIAQESFLALTDGVISDKKLKQLLGILSNSYSLRESLVEFENFELISSKVAEDTGILNDDMLGIVGAQDVYKEENSSSGNEKAEIIDSVLTDLIETEELKSEQKKSGGSAESLIGGAAAGLAAGAMAAGAMGAAETLAADALGSVAGGAIEGIANALSSSDDSDIDFLNELADNSTLSDKNNQKNNNENTDENSSENEDSSLDELESLVSDENQELLLDDLDSVETEPISAISDNEDELAEDVLLEDVSPNAENLNEIEDLSLDVPDDDTDMNINSLDDIGFVDEPVEEQSVESSQWDSLDEVGFADESVEEQSVENSQLDSLDNIGFADEETNSNKIENSVNNPAIDNDILPEGDSITYIPADEEAVSDEIPVEQENVDMTFNETKTDEANSIFANADVPFEGLPELSLNYDNDVPEYMKNMMGAAEGASFEDKPVDDQSENILPDTDSDLNVENDVQKYDNIENEELNVGEENIENDESVNLSEVPFNEISDDEDIDIDDINNLESDTNDSSEVSDETDSFISEIDDFLNSIDDGTMASEETAEENITEIPDLEQVDNVEKDPLQVLYKKENEEQDIQPDFPSEQKEPKTADSSIKKIIIAASVVAIVGFSFYTINNSGTKQNQNVPADNQELTQMQEENKQKRDDEFNQTLPQEETSSIPENTQTHTSQNMEESMTNAFAGEPINASISKIAWEIPEKYAYNNEFRQYLQIVGKNLKLNLQNELILSENMAYSDRVVVNIAISKEGVLQKAELIRSSGSKGIDKIVLQSVNSTLNYLKLPNGAIKDNSVDATLIISF